MKREECPICLGFGIIPVTQPPMVCPECGGLGYVEREEEEDSAK